MACDILWTYPDFNEEFDIHTDNSVFQLGAVTIQKGKPVSLYGRKLTDAHKRYTVIERELLITIETLKEFITIILSQKLIIYTYHKSYMK